MTGEKTAGGAAFAPRPIKRIAFLQEYRNRPETLAAILPEVAARGYRAAAFSVRLGQEEAFAELARQAAALGLEVMAFTGFMKYEETWLRDHPDQQMVVSAAKGAADQDRLGINWGCPFNATFRQRYLDFLRRLGRIPNLAEVWVNDEAYLGFSERQVACYCPTCAAEWQRESGEAMPLPPFPDRDARTRFVSWRLRRWNEVHARMKEALNADHRVQAVFLSNPPCCIGLNPWVSAVDLAAMTAVLDGVMTDPYYTFHLAHGPNGFLPREVYLSEMCRYVRGVASEPARAEICVQGFSHPTFTRPLDERDGWWAGVVPAALGLDGVTAYTYLLQKASPMQPAYEAAFRLDPFFARTRPLRFAAVVSSVETQCMHLDAAQGPHAWQQSRMLPAADMLRDHALPHAYLDARRLARDDLGSWPVIVLPGVTCLGGAARERLREYVAGGGVLLALGETATRDESGRRRRDAFMADLFGIRAQVPGDTPQGFAGAPDAAWFARLPWPDEVTAQYMGGVNRPALSLNHAVTVETAGGGAEVLAEFHAESGRGATPAILRRPFGRGHALYAAGIPARTFVRPEFGRPALNWSGRVLAWLLGELAGARLPLRAEGFPPRVPMQEVRPLDPRWMPTAEFLPCAGPDLYLAAIPSYFREPMQFRIAATPPAGKIVREGRELIADRTVTIQSGADGRVGIDVEFGFDDAMKVFAFFLGDAP